MCALAYNCSNPCSRGRRAIPCCCISGYPAETRSHAPGSGRHLVSTLVSVDMTGIERARIVPIFSSRVMGWRWQRDSRRLRWNRWLVVEDPRVGLGERARERDRKAALRNTIRMDIRIGKRELYESSGSVPLDPGGGIKNRAVA